MKSQKSNSEFGFTLIEVIITLVVVAIVAAMMTSYFGTSITQSSLPISRLQTASDLQQIMEIITTQYYQVPQWTSNTTYAAGATVLPSTLRRTGLQYKTTSGGASGSTEPDVATIPPTPWPVATGGTVTEISPGTITWTQNGAAPTLINQTWRPNKQYSKNTIIVYGNYQYITTNSGSSSTTQPSWGTASDWTGTESSGLTWKYSGPAPTVILQTLIGTAGALGETPTDYAGITFGSNPPVSYRVIENKFIRFTGNVEENINDQPDDGQYGMYLKVTIGYHSDTPNRTDEKLTTLFTVR